MKLILEDPKKNIRRSDRSTDRTAWYSYQSFSWKLVQFDDAAFTVFDLEGSGVEFYCHVVLVSRIFWYTPRVPAGEASAILEIAGVDDFALFVGDRELRRRRTRTVHGKTCATFPGGAEDRKT